MGSMTLNDSWGYQAADDNWKTSKTAVIRVTSSVACAIRETIFNIGPVKEMD